MGIPFPEEYGGPAATRSPTRSPSRSSRASTPPSRSRCARTPHWARSRSTSSVPRAEARVAAGPDRGAQARRVRPDRARGGLRRGQRAHPRAPRQRRLGDRRRQAVHHQRRHRHLRRRLHHRPHRRRRDLQPDRRQRHAGLRAGRAVSQDGLERVRHAAADLQGLPRAGGAPARPARQRLQAVPAHPRHRAHRRRGDGRRARAGRPGPGDRLREGAAGLRQADLEVPGDPGQARRHGDRDRGRSGC